MSIRELNFSRTRRLPVVLASEGAECGLACLAMVGSFHGHEVDLNGLRQRFPVSMSGASLRSLMQMATQLSLAPRALRVGLEALSKLALPAILHWDFNHFVVLKSVSARAAVIHDPALGERRMPIDELSRHFTGVALELAPAAGFEKIEAKETLRLSDLWSRLTGIWPAIFQILGLSLAFQVAAFALPFQIQLVVDEAIARADADLLTVLALGFGALTFIHAGLEAVRAWVVRILGSMMLFQIVGNLVRHLMRLPSSFFEKRHVGDIISRIESTNAIQDAVTRGMAVALIDGLMAILAAFILFLYSPLLAFVVCLSLALVLGISLAFYPVMRARTQEQLIASAREQTQLMETVRAATTIKIMGGESEREASWRNRYASVINASVSLGKYEITLRFLQNVIIGLQTVIVIYLGARSIIGADGLSIGMLMAFLSFRQTFSDRTLSLVTEVIQFRLLKVHLNRIADIAMAAGALPAASSGAAHEAGGSIELRDVAFRYGASDPLVLDQVSLAIEPGDYVAITGTSGGGKSTLFKLMLGLHEPETGEVLLDGRRATPELWQAWRTQVGVVAQDDRLLSGSIADNIAFFDPDLDMERVAVAASAARIHDDIVRMPMQYLSLIGDMGAALSGGQRQRLLLARALYRQPRLLLLDEGTANLDEQTEEEIARLIASLPITRIVIAHRPALIRNASRVFRVQEGRVVPVSSSPTGLTPVGG
ncbi:peptidase domain-containing ABC transporter [Aureimonas populi]|uniref:Peptidase domain-containing ABC transporter n=1 Tax=Aureimonas populi TaxID=1701758 RepID=A0ABW5CN20_9HYPH|nr:peptidase domain-containing ABC transporter [Aureimonas populi]